jgi:hypothetical protein
MTWASKVCLVARGEEHEMGKGEKQMTLEETNTQTQIFIQAHFFIIAI